MKELLVVVVGAGASVRAGISSTEELTRRVKDAMPLIEVPGVVTAQKGHVASPALSRFPSMADILDQALRADYGSDYDFERILHALEELETFLEARYNPEGSTLADTPVLGSFAELMRRFECINDESVIRRTRLDLLKLIHGTVSSNCDYPLNAHIAIDARQQLERLFAALSKRFRLVVIDFNYDDLLDRMALAWEDGFTFPVENRFCSLFEPDRWRTFVEDNSSNLLVHLHGSVRYGYRPQETLSNVAIRFAEPAKYEHLAGARESVANTDASGTRANGEIADAAYIVSGLRKAGKLAYNARPYGYYYRTVMDFMPRTKRLLILGYGWRDLHVNTWINEYIELHPERRTAVITLRLGQDVGNLQLPEHQMLARDSLPGPPCWE